MATTVELLGPCRKKLRIEIATDRVAGTRAEILKEFRKAARIPGFRPGFAPEPMVEKRYAKEIDEELRKRLVPEGYREAVAAEKLKPVGYPQVDSVEYHPGQPLVFTATIDTTPEFSLPEYKGIKVDQKLATVADADITQTLDSLRDQQAEFVTVEGRPLQMADFAVIDYSGVVDGKPIIELAPEAKTLGENHDFWIQVEVDAFLKGFCDQLVGARPGEKRQVLIDFPAEFPQTLLAGKKATYFVTLKAIKEKKLPELNDEFAKKVGAESLEKLQSEIRQGLLAERENESKGAVRKQIVDHLLGSVQFELPEALVAQETRSIVYDLVRENTMRGASKEQLEEKKDEIFGFANKSAQERLRTSFILDAISQAEKIEVTSDEVEERVRLMSQRYRITPQKMKEQIAERGGLDEVEEQVRVSKTLDFLIANAKVQIVS